MQLLHLHNSRYFFFFFFLFKTSDAFLFISPCKCDTHWNCLARVIPMSNQNIFLGEIKQSSGFKLCVQILKYLSYFFMESSVVIFKKIASSRGLQLPTTCFRAEIHVLIKRISYIELCNNV